MNLSRLAWLPIVVSLLLSAAPLRAQERPRLEFTRLVAHWAEYADPGYLSFIDDAQPDIAQVGFYGAHFWSLAHTPHGQGYPAHFPVVGLNECGQWFADLNGELHKRHVKVVGHFNVKFLVGDPDSAEGPRGFFKFYRDLWNEQELGPRPAADPLDFLERDADGKPLVEHNYQIGGMAEYWGCLNNPQWRAVLKVWARRGIERGVDGYIINYFYRHNCLCHWCQDAFKEYLRGRYTPEQLRERFGIADLAAHQFPEIVSWHDPAQTTPLRLEMLRFSQVANKRAFDDVFVEYGRSLKPDLIVAQWDHLGDFNQITGDERCLLPADRWGKDEDYLWYSSGGAAYFTDLAEGFLGELTLQARYIRGAFDDKPFTMGKYENTRVRAAIAELAANGGAPMGFYTRFQDPLAREEIVRYYRFLKRYDDLYRGNHPHGETLLLYPRGKVHAGDLTALDAFKRVGRQLLDAHVLFDIRPDDVVVADERARYRQVYDHATTAIQSGDGFSRFEAPGTVRVSASRPAQGEELTLHFVNYNRQEPAEKRSAGQGLVDEKPLAVPEIRCDVSLPADFHATRVEVMTPEAPDPVELPIQTSGGRLHFTLPPFLVYSVVRVR